MILFQLAHKNYLVNILPSGYIDEFACSSEKKKKHHIKLECHLVERLQNF